MSAVEPFSAVEIIAAKRDKFTLTNAQIDWVIDAYTRGVVADEQMSAIAYGNFAQRHEFARDFSVDKCNDQ